MSRDDLEQMLRAAYEQGAHDVHENWQEDRDPDFTEAAYDYVANLNLSAPRSPIRVPPGGEGWQEQAAQWALEQSSMHHRFAHENPGRRVEHIASSSAYRNLADVLRALPEPPRSHTEDSSE